MCGSLQLLNFIFRVNYVDFFVESIGIVLAIPVSIIITSVMMKMSVKKVKKIC